MLLLRSQAAHGQEQRYRVELLVLRHLEGYSASQPAPALKDFSASMDLLAPPAENSLSGQVDLPGVQTGAQSEGQSGNQSGNQSGAQSGNGPQPPVVLRETPGEAMEQAWRRLHGANGLRPELYFSWEQAASAGSPKIRVHDKDLVFEQDPEASLQDAAAFQPAGAARAQADSGSARGKAAGGELKPEGTTPGLVQYFRLDGTAALRVSRFLHLDLDIEFRETAAAVPQPGSVQPGVDTSPPRAYTVYAIRQSRQVQIQDLHYFDGPVIAVLAMVTRVEPLPEAGQ